MLDFLKGPFLAIQEFFILAGSAVRNVFRSPHYADDIILQMDQIGVGSLPIVILTGFFSGAVMALQGAGAARPTGPLVVAPNAFFLPLALLAFAAILRRSWRLPGPLCRRACDADGPGGVRTWWTYGPAGRTIPKVGRSVMLPGP